MNFRLSFVAALTSFSLFGCGSLMDNALINDDEVMALSEESCQKMDSASTIAPANSKYSKRLNKIAKNLGSNVNGIPLNYKVYKTKEVNAWAMANGCVRVYSGLMDRMTNDEVQGVLGHEIGHVALGHSKKAMQIAYSTAIVRGAAGTFGNEQIAALTDSQLGDLTESLINAQFSQSQEADADNYSYELLKKNHLNTYALVTAFNKLAEGSGSSSALNQMFSTHPDSAARAARIKERIAKDSKK